MKRVDYEWCVEELDIDYDVIGINLYEPGELSDAVEYFETLKPLERDLCLYARTWDRNGEVECLLWAYVREGELQPHLYLGHGYKPGQPQRKVPQRLMAEFNRIVKGA